MECAVTHQLNQHQAQEDKFNLEGDWIEDQKNDLADRLKDATNIVVSVAVEDFNINFVEWLVDNYKHDGVTEYFIYGNNNYFSMAIEVLLDSIDWNARLEAYKKECEDE